MLKKLLPLSFLFFSVICIAQKDFRKILEQTKISTLDSLSQTWGERAISQKKAALAKAKIMGWPVQQTLPSGEFIELQRLDENGEPVYYTTFNVNSAATSRTDRVHSGGGAGLNLEGNGMVIGEWDAGSVRLSHEQFEGRAIQMDGTATNPHSHAVHVAGTLIGDGTGAGSSAVLAKGMAPKATLHAYGWGLDVPEMAAAAADGLLVSNHSYGTRSGWRLSGSVWQWGGGNDNFHGGGEAPIFGKYHTSAKEWDIISENAPFYLIFQAAGNDRGENPSQSTLPVWNPITNEEETYDPALHPVDDGDFDCLTSPGSSKNAMVVGAVNDVLNYSGPSSVPMSSFSCWGPTDDGRIKPDITANGVGLLSANSSADTTYFSASGTSMASPSGAGSAILLQEHFQNVHGSGSFMRSSTLRGLIIHSADEAGDHPGPDYGFGWGLMNTEAAAAVITQDSLDDGTIQEINLESFDFFLANVVSDGSEPLVATIAWTDPAGEISEYNTVDDPDLKLVNDLDMELAFGCDVFRPYILDPANPELAAATGDNFRDNVEKIFIENPAPGTYSLTVRHKEILKYGSQFFSLIVTGGEVEPYSSPILAEGCSQLLAPFDGETQVSVSTDLTWSAASGNPLGYRLNVGTAPCATDILDNFDVGNVTSYDLPNDLPANTAIYLTIIPYNSGGDVLGCAEERFFTEGCFSGNVVFVDSSASGANDGSSWADAFVDLQHALPLAASCPNLDEIWVAAGTYRPTSGGDRGVSFFLENGVAIYGGFDGTESQLSERDWQVNETTLSGDIGEQDDISDNSYHVIWNYRGQGQTAVLDGFTILGGNANFGFDHEKFGGGMLNDSSSPTVSNCRFLANAADHGAAVCNRNQSAPRLTNCAISGNASMEGGGIFNENSSPEIVNSSFSGNYASTTFGGGVFNVASSPVLTNCILWGDGGTEIENDSTSASVVSYCIVEGGYPGAGNSSDGPFFVNQPEFFNAPTAEGNLHLQPGSYAIDAGTSAGAPSTDFDGNTRPMGTAIDMGFDESGENCGGCGCPAGQVVFVDSSSVGTGDGGSWANALTNLQDAIHLGNGCPDILQVWVAAGTYFPTNQASRASTFLLKNNLTIYGGFAGTETELSQRNIYQNETILSGDIGAPGDSTDNSFNVVLAFSHLNSFAILDGFSIVGGNADGSSFSYGGGMVSYFSSPTLMNCLFRGNAGGGVYNYFSSPTFNNCRFLENTGGNFGAMANLSSSPVLNNSVFEKNEGTIGGGLRNLHSSPLLLNCSFLGNSAQAGGATFDAGYGGLSAINCQFIGNSALGAGGAIGCFGVQADATFTNCTFSGNSSGSQGGAIYYQGVTPLQVTNSILWGNSSEIEVIAGGAEVSHSIVQGGYAGTGNLDEDPLFILQPPIGLGVAGDLSLEECSPAIDFGNNGANSMPFDLAGNQRKVLAKPPGAAVIDLGAFEFQSEVGNCNCIAGLTVVADPVPDGAHSALGELTSHSSTVADGTSVKFTSDTGILISHDFTVELGAVFEAVIEGCANAFSQGEEQ